MKLCGYGCGIKAKYPPRKGMTKWCCSMHYNSCPSQKQLKANILRKSGVLKGKVPWNKGKKGLQVAWNKEKKNCWSETTITKANIKRRLSLKKIEERYPFFYKIEEIKESSGMILVRCKNNDCKNSKEKGGWFPPTYIQLYERIRALEYIDKDYNYFYCSQKCKNNCTLYRKKESELLYTAGEYQTFRQHVLERDNYKCQFCEENATDVHHERPQKLEPFFALDPDYGWSCCEKCHYEKGHQGECSTKNLSLIKCN